MPRGVPTGTTLVIKGLLRERDEAQAELNSTRADLHLCLKTNATMQDEIDALLALLRSVKDRINRWREDDDRGFHELIGVVCAVADEIESALKEGA